MIYDSLRNKNLPENNGWTLKSFQTQKWHHKGSCIFAIYVTIGTLLGTVYCKVSDLSKLFMLSPDRFVWSSSECFWLPWLQNWTVIWPSFAKNCHEVTRQRCAPTGSLSHGWSGVASDLLYLDFILAII